MSTDVTGRGDHGGTEPAAAADRAVKDAHRAMWALGDYPKVARDVLADLGTELAAACGAAPGVRALDIGTGSGLAAIAAAEAGATVVASDLTPALLAAGRSEAAQRGLTLDWREADAESLPFDDNEFDVVMSSLGAIFAPRHQAVADEMIRVCRPGGTIGMITWTAGGSIDGFLSVFAPYAPPPAPWAQPPTLWGDEQHVRDLFGTRVESLTMTAEHLRVDHFEDPREFCAYYKANFGPTIATYAHIADDSAQTAALDRDFLAYADRTNLNPQGSPAVFEYDYSLVLARTRG